MQIQLRDPGKAYSVTVADQLSPHHTKKCSRPTRGRRSLHAALAALVESPASPFDEERFSEIAFASVFFRERPNKSTHPAEAFIRFAAFRYVVDEIKKRHPLMSYAELAGVLLADADSAHQMERYYHDIPGEEIADWVTCSNAAVVAYNRGWLPYLTADWMVDEGALAVLHLINFRPIGSGEPEAYGPGKSLGRVQCLLGCIRARRTQIGRRARHALGRLRDVCPALDHHAACLRIAKRKDKNVLERGSACRAKLAAESLDGLRAALADTNPPVHWQVSGRSRDFLDQADCLANSLRACSASQSTQDLAQMAGYDLISLRTGISLPDLGRALGGGNFFQEVVSGSLDDDLDQATFDFSEPAEADGERGAPATLEVQLSRETEFARTDDVWRPVWFDDEGLPTPVDSSRTLLRVALP